ncbi:MAG: efflux RND transporter permease subunit [Bryobacterales bacterium]|nr:efflux RND transporter permease subunit [Bryobacterales bacterium]
MAIVQRLNVSSVMSAIKVVGIVHKNGILMLDAAMLPLTWGVGSRSQIVQPLAIAVIGGVTGSMVLSLLLKPVLFYLLCKHRL